MNIPADWISEARLAQETGVPDEEEARRKFHRNLENWRRHERALYPQIETKAIVRLLPKSYDGLPVPSVRPLGVGNGPGNEAC